MDDIRDVFPVVYVARDIHVQTLFHGVCLQPSRIRCLRQPCRTEYSNRKRSLPRELTHRQPARCRVVAQAQRRVEVKLKFDPEQKGTLLGKGGATINRVQQESQGASLEISKGDECTIRIWGPCDDG